MLGIVDFPLFVLSGLLLNATPGPDTLLVLGRTAAQGRRAGALAALGIGAGCLVHALAVATGVSALLATSPLGFELLRWAGAAILLWVGVGLLRAAPAPSGPPPAPAGPAQVFAQGFLGNLLNPKVALFFVAFLPQFVDPAAEQRGLGLLVLGAVFAGTGTLWLLALACGTGALARRLRPPARWGRALQRLIGGVLVALGLRLALQR